MNAGIITFRMDNVPAEVTELQKRVVRKFNPACFPHHSFLSPFKRCAEFYEWVWTWCGHDVILFLDSDCVPLDEGAIEKYLAGALAGRLVGNIGRTGHKENGAHVFAQPAALAISRDTWDKLGHPPTEVTPRGDCCEEWTWAATERGVPVELVPVRRCDKVFFPGQEPRLGWGSVFGYETDLFYHHWQIRHQERQQSFIEKCKALLQ